MKFTTGLVLGFALVIASSCSRVSTVNGCPLQPYANCAGKDLSNQLYNLQGLDLNHINLNGANLNGSDLTGTILSDADLTGVTVSATTILSEADLSRAKLANVTWNAAVDATKIKLVEAKISGSTFTGVNFTGGDFSKAIISCSNFSDGSLNQAIENGTQINSTTFAATTSRIGIVTNSDTEQCLVLVDGNVQFTSGACTSFTSTCKPRFCPQIGQAQCTTIITKNQCNWVNAACVGV